MTWITGQVRFLMMTDKITPTVDYNQWMKTFDTQINEPTNQNYIKVPKANKKKTLIWGIL